MPYIIKHIDAIAREKKRGVLYIEFHPENDAGEKNKYSAVFPPFIDWRDFEPRKKLIAWLNENEIPWMPCGGIANKNWMLGYEGQLYIDVPFDTSMAMYQKLAMYLENEDGTMRQPGIVFWYLSLDLAMENKEHDEPGYWERWADNF